MTFILGKCIRKLPNLVLFCLSTVCMAINCQPKCRNVNFSIYMQLVPIHCLIRSNGRKSYNHFFHLIRSYTTSLCVYYDITNRGKKAWKEIVKFVCVSGEYTSWRYSNAICTQAKAIQTQLFTTPIHFMLPYISIHVSQGFDVMFIRSHFKIIANIIIIKTTIIMYQIRFSVS